MIARIYYVYLAALFIWNTDSTTLFFKDLSTKKPYSNNHLFHPLPDVAFKDSIMYFQDSDYILVSTNNTIIKLDLDKLSVQRKIEVMKGNNQPSCFKDKYSEEYPCHLFGYWTKIISSSSASDNHQLFICHNNGMASYHNLTTENLVHNKQSYCPPLSVLSLMSTDKHFYVAALGGGPKVLRFKATYPDEFQYTTKKNLVSKIESSWIQQNDYLQFVSVFEKGNFVYLLLREMAEEDSVYCHAKGVKSRIVKISKDDTGGSGYALTDNWISFMKATLLCPDRSGNIKDSSLNYVENAYFDEERLILYATFSSGRSAPAKATICQYSMPDIEASFQGQFLNVNDLKNPIAKAETSCQSRDCIIRQTAKYQMMFSPVIPNMKRNLILQNGEIWTHVQVLTIDRSSRQYDIVFVATSKGQIKKYFRKLPDNSLCYSETLVLLSNNENQLSAIRDMKLINSKNSQQPFIVVTVNRGVYKIGIEHCQIHSRETTCIDPFCYWEESTQNCSSIFQITVYKLRQLPELTHCSKGKELYNQIWEEWSSWDTCGQRENVCQCRMRNCKIGKCVNTLPLMENVDIEVRNCTDHNQWSSWGAWSECSSKCGRGNTTRQRWCFQNGYCPGENVQTKTCAIQNKCTINKTIIEWSSWSECSSKCGLGIQKRFNNCDKLDQENNPKCSLFEYKSCAGTKCQVLSKLSPVVKLLSNTGAEYYMAGCEGDMSEDEEEMMISVEYEELHNSVLSNFIWNCWSEWTKCSNQCTDSSDGLNKKSRKRDCKIRNEHVKSDLCTDPTLESGVCTDNSCYKTLSSLNENGFPLIYVILVGVACFTFSCLAVVAGVCIYFAKRKTITHHTQSLQLHTLPRSSFIRESYSPSQQSPPHSPLEFGWIPTDGYMSLSRGYKKANPPLIDIPIPTVV